VYHLLLQRMCIGCYSYAVCYVYYIYNLCFCVNRMENAVII
jgi:hypothetical protein